MTSALGLSPDVKTLNAFLAAAGFTEAAAFQGLGDPPFIRQNWAVAQFKLPDNPGLNASMLVNTTGVRTNINCEQSTSLNLNTSTPPYYNITAQGADGCSATVQFNVSASSLDEQQYGSAPANAQNCGLPADTDIDFLPLMFWFYNTDAQNIPQAAAVICRPQIQLFNVMANVNLNNGSLVDVTILNNYTAPNNVSGDPLDGKVYNAVLFNTSATDPFVTARATAISAQIPGAIFRLASQDANFVQFFDNGSTGFLNLTKEIYTQHLAVSAKTVYFVPADETKSAQETSQIDRLLMDTFASQALALLLIGVGLVGIVTHLLHRRQRRNLYLTSAPGTIATIIALSSHSGFGELLYPYDNKKAILEKFANLRFSLDRRTGAIVADEYEYDEGVGADRSGRTSDAGMDDEEKVEMHRMDTMASLTGDGKNRVGEKQVEGVEPKRQVDPLAFPYEHEPLILPPSRSPSRSPAARSASP
ncbi:hypothetical protein PHLCEN_2v8098 [Hermanssonia centrifuga]|uniref:Uncharacterized protein n=1 Tax=Hermanssonia centrifuga TaxID=98765 RepID=A0A2R6NUN2_9APHY|nr:hypothetical protein PHLCEN_2v8098 [Hermanssonia centrifuga]